MNEFIFMARKSNQKGNVLFCYALTNLKDFLITKRKFIQSL